jgi:hypothetical protein
MDNGAAELLSEKYLYRNILERFKTVQNWMAPYLAAAHRIIDTSDIIIDIIIDIIDTSDTA